MFFEYFYFTNQDHLETWFPATWHWLPRVEFCRGKSEPGTTLSWEDRRPAFRCRWAEPRKVDFRRRKFRLGSSVHRRVRCNESQALRLQINNKKTSFTFKLNMIEWMILLLRLFIVKLPTVNTLIITNFESLGYV